MDDYILRALERVEKKVDDLSTESAKTKEIVANLRECWDKTDVEKRVSNAERNISSQSEKCAAVLAKKQKPVAFLVGVMGAVVGSSLSFLVQLVLKKLGG